jgi:hypothetical protein
MVPMRFGIPAGIGAAALDGEAMGIVAGSFAGAAFAVAFAGSGIAEGFGAVARS